MYSIRCKCIQFIQIDFMQKVFLEMMSPQDLTSLLNYHNSSQPSHQDRSINAVDTTKRKDPAETEEEEPAKEQKKAE